MPLPIRGFLSRRSATPLLGLILFAKGKHLWWFWHDFFYKNSKIYLEICQNWHVWREDLRFYNHQKLLSMEITGQRRNFLIFGHGRIFDQSPFNRGCFLMTVPLRIVARKSHGYMFWWEGVQTLSTLLRLDFYIITKISGLSPKAGNLRTMNANCWILSQMKYFLQRQLNQCYFLGGQPSRGVHQPEKGATNWGEMVFRGAEGAAKIFFSTFMEFLEKLLIVHKNAMKSDFWDGVGRYIL